MNTFRAMMNMAFKHINRLELTVKKCYYGEELVRVEVESPVTGTTVFYDGDWERHISLIKYNEGRKHGVWIKTLEGYFGGDMVQVSREFYTK
ncbi:MAG: hypothetical protein ACRCZ2_06785 [Fusobacteriaceae bacterium]